MIYVMSGGAKLFAAIGVKFSAGSLLTCSCVENGRVLTAKTTSDQTDYVFAVPNAGTWTVAAGAKSKSFNIIKEGQFETANFSELVLFDNGVVDGISLIANSASQSGSHDDLVKIDDKIRLNYKSRVGWSGCSVAYQLDLTEYNALKLKGKINWANEQASYPTYIGVTDTAPMSNGSDGGAVILENQRIVQTKLATVENTYSVDVSSISGVHYVVFGGTDNAEASRLWLE